MKTENPYDADWDGTNDEYRWNEGYTAAMKDHDAEMAKLANLLQEAVDYLPSNTGIREDITSYLEDTNGSLS